MANIIEMNEDKDPWRQGGNKKDEGDALEESIKQFRAKLKGIFAGGGSSSGRNTSEGGSDGFGIIAAGIIGLVVIIWALSGIFLVKPAEKAVITQFGKYKTTVGPGPHWIPRFIENEYVVNEQQVSSYQYSHNMLTTDENLVDVSVVVQYRIGNAKDYLFNVVNPTISLQQATASALRQVIGDMTLGAILSTGREELRDRVAGQLNTILDLYHTGLVVTEVASQPAMPPDQVRAAFDDVINAMEDEQRFNNEAQAQALQLEQKASGQSQRILNEAKAFRDQVVLQAKARTANFLAVLIPYEKSPQVTRERMYMDAMQSVLDRSTKLLLDVGNKSNSMFYLPLDKILKNEGVTNVSTKLSDYDSHKNTTPTDSNEKGGFNLDNYSAGQQAGKRPGRPWNIPVSRNQSNGGINQ